MTRPSLIAAGLCCAALAWPLRAQQPGPGVLPFSLVNACHATAGSAAEHTIAIARLIASDRALATTAPSQMRNEASSTKTMREATDSELRCRTIGLATSQSTVWLNSGGPRAEQDGAVWQGRGLTAALTAGGFLQMRYVSVALQPLLFVTQNQEFLPLPAAENTGGFANPLVGLDMPYRFGNERYHRFDPGESWIRFGDARYGVGFSTSSQHWGPAHIYPLVLSTEGGGFPRAFAEITGLPVVIGSVNAQWIVGRLEPSETTPLDVGDRSRLATAITGTFAPAGFPGLTIGGTRFFHVRWNRNVLGWPTVSLPFKGLTKKTNPTGETFVADYNQLASVFVSLAPPRTSVEVYGEFYRDDHSYDLGDFEAEPDHESSYVIGLRRAWRSNDAIRAATLEVANSRFTHLLRVRPQIAPYLHGRIIEGHTYLGQPLGSSALLGGGGMTLVLDRIADKDSRTWRLEIRRLAQDSEGGAFRGEHLMAYSVSYETWRCTRFGNYGVSGGVQHNDGLNPRTNVMVSIARLWR